MTAHSVKQIAEMLNARIADLARDLLGEPNRELSSAQQLRFGTHGSVAVEIGGENAGRWYDHEQGAGGDGLELVKHRRRVVNGEALDWARQWLGLPAYTPSGRSPPPPTHDDGPPCGPDWLVDDTAPAHDADFHDDFPPIPLPLEGQVSPPDAPATPSTEQQDPWATPSPTKKSAKKAEEDAKRAAKVAAIVADCEDPHGTRVEIYLRSRAIIQTPLPPSIRYLSNAYNHYGALLALATDDQGQVHGLQLIYLT